MSSRSHSRRNAIIAVLIFAELILIVNAIENPVNDSCPLGAGGTVGAGWGPYTGCQLLGSATLFFEAVVFEYGPIIILLIAIIGCLIYRRN